MGRIHSLETMGLLDGPGIRFVVFFQGCRLRCAYCHNPDTWDLKAGLEMTPQELLCQALKYAPYFTKSGGGITCSGGEPLMQPEYLLEFLKLCKAHGLHTTLDTAGFGKGHYQEILAYTDLVILDLKHTDDKGYTELTGQGMKEFREFKEALDHSHSRVWIRHVVIPGLTDNLEHLKKIHLLANSFKNLEKIELLPYHTLGLHKYEALGMKSRLEGLNPLEPEKIRILEKKYLYLPIDERMFGEIY